MYLYPLICLSSLCLMKPSQEINFGPCYVNQGGNLDVWHNFAHVAKSRAADAPPQTVN